MHRRLYPGLFIGLLTLYACSNDQREKGYVAPKDPLFTTMPSTETGIHFINQVSDTREFNVFRYRNFYNGGGVAIGDVNNDGLADIFFTANQQSNRLYINKGNWKFEDVTDKAGVQGIRKWHTGVTMVDINHDGWLDIYVCNSGDINGDDRANELYINQQNGTFREEAASWGLDEKGLTTHAAFFDYDRDGDLDCYILNNSFRPIESFGYNRGLRNKRDSKGGDKLLRNDNGKFTDVSEQARIYGSEIGFGLGVTVGDVNNDLWPDIYISNDFFERDYLYINQQDGTFREVGEQALRHTSMSSMGADIADINNDDYLDIFTTDMLPEGDYRLKTTTKFDDFDVYSAKIENDFHHQYTRNGLQLNNGNGTFSEIGLYADVAATDWSWGALIFDLNNDGWKDLVVCNGISRDLTNQDFLEYFGSAEVMNQIRRGGMDYKQLLDKMPATPIPNYAFVNQNGLRFRNRAYELGLGEPSFSNGAAYGDLDNDGDLDLVVNNENQPAFVYRNQSREKENTTFLQFRLKGEGKNTFGLGTRIKVFAEGKTFTCEQLPARGFQSSVDPVLHVGLGKATRVDSVQVIWPDARMQVLQAPAINRQYEIQQKDALQKYRVVVTVSGALLIDVSKSAGVDTVYHRENDYIDFDRERLAPMMLSTQGPRLAEGDINGDGLPDLFVGGAIGDPGKLLLQKPAGNYVPWTSRILEFDQLFEDAGAAFFDADGNGTQDLWVASGGNEGDTTGSAHISRLYLNDGKGEFKPAIGMIPELSQNASVVRPCDFDRDGDIDVLVGGRSIPGIYGRNPPTYLFRNEGKAQFTQATSQASIGLERVGMVTDAQWLDIDADGWMDLILVGDWMPVTLFRNNKGRLEKWKELPDSKGLWNCLVPADLDGDGDMDYVAGNLGENAKWKADDSHPMKLFVNDFDKNGTEECVLTYFKSDSVSYPYYLRGDLVMQLPSLKKKFLRFDQYAGKTIEQVFDKEQLSSALVKQAEYLSNSVLLNEGNGNFRLVALPPALQWSPLYAAVATDLDGDGIPDILTGGNFFGVKPEIGRMDANYGMVLKGLPALRNGKSAGNAPLYELMPIQRTGIQWSGEVRDLKLLPSAKGKQRILVARNNEPLLMYQLK